jgi:ribonucleoside-diphosphate reductase alpha chain
MNFLNPTPKVGALESTNPCGEQPLLAYESCNLGSLNLGEYFLGPQKFDWVQFRRDIRHAVRFLDNIIDLNDFPVKASEKITLKNRKIGLGVMGFADLLLLMGIPYDSAEGREMGERLMSVLDREAKNGSVELARRRGAFAHFKGSLWDRLGYPPLRNATVSTVAPTGTISIIAGASSGIEPIFSASFFRNVLSGEKLAEIHPIVRKALAGHPVLAEVSVEELDRQVGRLLGPVWSPAQRVSVEGHVRMQAAFQRHSDSAVSKTINLPQEATLDDVAKAYFLAYELGCKGITVYRDQSRPEQVLNHAVCVTCRD